MQFDLSSDNQPVTGLVTAEAFANFARRGPSLDKRPVLEELSSQRLFTEIKSPDMANCCVSGLWLLHNFLHESHEISQSIHTVEGSWWHAIMHRLEGDYWNSKYWYRKVGDHPAFAEMADDWDPRRFVDRCERDRGVAAESGGELHEVACAEWRCLFQYCWQHAGE